MPRVAHMTGSAKKHKKSKLRHAGGGSKYRSVGAALGGGIGSMLGGPSGMAIGSVLGSSAADMLKHVTGIGDYVVNYNTILHPDQVPEFSRGNKRGFIVTHREYIMDVISSASAGAFNINSFAINPGDPATFPWLSNIAQQFEEYRIHGMIFNFKTTSADALNSTNTALGTVVMATQYNTISPAFTNKQQMENYEFGSSTTPSNSLMHPIECDPKISSFGPVYTVRLGAGTDTGDERLYDIGRFSIATVGMQGTSVNLGELSVTYQCEFFKPRLSNTEFAVHWQLGGASGTVTAAAPLSNAILSSTSANFTGITLTSGGVITFPNTFTGNVSVTYAAFGTVGAACVDPGLAASGGAANLLLLDLNTKAGVGKSYAAASTALEITAYFTVTNGGAVTISGGTYPTGVVIGDLVINTFPMQLNN